MGSGAKMSCFQKGNINSDLESEIINLIELHQEGEYWDFKRQWYDSSKVVDLLHDIICMANNLANHDAYIIIGVDNENFSLYDVAADQNRRNTQKIVDFLKDKKFAGDIRPIVTVKQVLIKSFILDVIIIHNSRQTPFYLKEKFQSLKANHIYTRIQDSNTPKDKSADIDKVECLWKKRFGLVQTPNEKFEIYLKDSKNWMNISDNTMEMYYKIFPEYRLIYDFDESRHGYEYYHFFQSDSTPSYLKIQLYYHQTLLADFVGLSLDGGRYDTPCPETDGIAFNAIRGWDVMFKYMEKDSLIFKLNEFLYCKEYTDDARISRNNFFESILVFNSKEERLNFKRFVKRNWKECRKHYSSEIQSIVPTVPKLGNGYTDGAFKQECEDICILQKMLSEYRRIDY